METNELRARISQIERKIDFIIQLLSPSDNESEEELGESEINDEVKKDEGKRNTRIREDKQ